MRSGLRAARRGRGLPQNPATLAGQRTFGWIMMHRRFARDCETKPEHSESMIRSAAIDNLARRATGESTMACHNL